MAERVVKVSLRAEINNYLSGMDQAARKTREVGSEAEKAAAKLQQQKEAFNLIGGAALAAGTLAAVAVGAAVKKWADFDEAMSSVAAATHETEANMGKLRDAALEAGARTVFSATEAANAIEELGKAGLSTGDILSGGLDGALDLAAAGGLGVADAAGIAAVALKTFKLEGKDMAHVADLLSAGAGKAMGDVTDLSAALKQGGQVAAQTGLSIEETTGTLAAFAAQGLLGSDAGTSFKSMLQRLTPQSNEAKDAMKALGISAYDASGEFIGMEAFAGNLQASLMDLTTEQRNSALATIFGSDAVRAASVLYSEGEEGIRDWIAAVDDQGYAAETAAMRLDNLKGDWEAFGGAVDTAMIKAGEAADGPLRFLTQAATDMVESFADAPDAVQQTAFWIGAAGAAALTAGGLFLLGVPKVAQYKAAVATLGTTAQRTSRFVGAMFKGLAIAGTTAAALTFLDTWLKSLEATNAELENVARTADNAHDALQRSSKGLDIAYWGEVKTSVEDVKGALESAANSSVNLADALSQSLAEKATLKTIEQFGDGLAELANTDFPAAQAGFRAFTEEFKLNDVEVWRAIQNSGAYKEVLTQQANDLGLAADKQNLLKLAMGETAPAVEDNSAALAELSGAATDTQGSIDGLADSIRGFGSAELDTRAAARDLEQAFDDLQASIDENGATLDIHEQAGRDNEKALDDLATSTLELAAATVEQTGSQDAANGVITDGRQKLIDMLGQFGITGQAAEDYADKLGLIPDNVDTAVELNKTQAEIDLDNWVNQYRVIHIDTHVATGPGGAGGLTEADGGVVKYFGNGGHARERHVAQMAPAGAWRVWAEPETGGESYIPHAPSKRARSLQVWAETGAILGVPGFANGGIVPPVYAQAGAAIGGASQVVNQSFTLPVVAREGKSAWQQGFEAIRGAQAGNPFNSGR